MKNFFVILFAVVSVNAVAQNQQTIIKTEALKMAKALAAMDLETYASYSWPALVSDAKSKQMIKQGVDSADKYRKQYGVKVKSIIIGNPSAVVTHKGVMQCTIPQNLTVEAMMGSLSTETTLVGLSNDGKKWYFVAATLFKSADAKTKLPELSPKLVIPVDKPPVIKGIDTSALKKQ